METLTPELERQIQVEELWARRIVLADSKNEARRIAYQTRRVLGLFPNEIPAESVRDQEREAATARELKPNTTSTRPAIVMLAVATMLLLIGLCGTRLLAGTISVVELSGSHPVAVKAAPKFVARNRPPPAGPVQAGLKIQVSTPSDQPFRPLQHDVDAAFSNVSTLQKDDYGTSAQDAPSAGRHKDKPRSRKRGTHQRDL